MQRTHVVGTELKRSTLEEMSLLNALANTVPPIDMIIATNIKRLTNQLWKLIPMRENEENWLNQLETVIIEIVGLKEIFLLTPSFLVLLSKLE